MSPQRKSTKKSTQRKAPEPHFNLHLTSPHMSDARMGGNLIHRAQQALHANRYGEFYHPAHNDGVYGPETAAATKHAKYALGFPEKDVNLRFDDPLWVRLTGERPLGAAYEKRRKERRKPNVARIKERMVTIAVKEEGYREGANNSNKYGAWYGLNNAPWCAIFASWCAEHAGYKWFHYSYCPTIYSAALHGDHGMSLTQHPERGDLILVGSNPIHHVGIVVDPSPFKWVSGNWGDSVDVTTSRPSEAIRYVHMPTH